MSEGWRGDRVALGLSHAFTVPKQRRLAEGKLQRLPRRRRERRRRRRLHRNKYRQTAMDQRGAMSRGGRGGAGGGGGGGGGTACSAHSRHLIGLMGCAVTHRLYRVVQQSPPSWTLEMRRERAGKGGRGRAGGEEVTERARR